LKSHGDRETKFSFPSPTSHLLQRCLRWMAGNQRVLVAARDVSAGRKPANTGAATEMSLLTGLPDSTEGCQITLVDKLGVSPSQYHHPWSTSQNHPGMNKRPIQAAVLRCQSHPIIAHLPIYPPDRRLGGPQSWY
jgi:hypothetical protein